MTIQAYAFGIVFHFLERYIHGHGCSGGAVGSQSFLLWSAAVGTVVGLVLATICSFSGFSFCRPYSATALQGQNLGQLCELNL